MLFVCYVGVRLAHYSSHRCTVKFDMPNSLLNIDFPMDVFYVNLNNFYENMKIEQQLFDGGFFLFFFFIWDTNVIRNNLNMLDLVLNFHKNTKSGLDYL